MIHVLHSITAHYFYYFYYEQPQQQQRHDTSGLGAQGSLTTRRAAKIRPLLRDLFRGLDLVTVLENFPVLCTQGTAWAKFFKDETNIPVKQSQGGGPTSTPLVITGGFSTPPQVITEG